MLVVGGNPTGTPPLALRSEIYDPIAGTWTLGDPEIFNQREHASALLPDGSVIVIGGSIGAPGGPWPT